jgi:hypothetical protein
MVVLPDHAASAVPVSCSRTSPPVRRSPPWRAPRPLAAGHPAVDEAARLLGEGIANLLDPEIVVVGSASGR